jgi:hypothetical protein
MAGVRGVGAGGGAFAVCRSGKWDCCAGPSRRDVRGSPSEAELAKAAASMEQAIDEVFGVLSRGLDQA